LPKAGSASLTHLWPRIVQRCAVATDTHAFLAAKLGVAAHKT
jgi:hypothetical protein